MARRRKPAKGKALTTTVERFEDGTSPGEVLAVHREDGVIVGRLVRSSVGGAIWQGKAPNHRPGNGPPAEHVRERARISWDERISRLESIVDNPVSDPRAVVAAMAQLAKIGLGSQVHVKGEHLHAVVMLPEQKEPELPTLTGTPVVDVDVEVEEPGQ